MTDLLNTLTAGDKIVVRSLNSARDGFVSNFGRFLRLKHAHDGRVFAFEYDWNGQTAFRFIDRVTVTLAGKTAIDDAIGAIDVSALRS